MRLTRNDGTAVRLTLGPGYAASFAEIHPDGKVREVAAARSTSGCARMLTDPRATTGRVHRDTVTEFARGGIRRDRITVNRPKVDEEGYHTHRFTDRST